MDRANDPRVGLVVFAPVAELHGSPVHERCGRRREGGGVTGEHLGRDRPEPEPPER